MLFKIFCICLQAFFYSTFAWWQNFRRLSKDYEINPDNSAIIAKVIAIRLNIKKLIIDDI